jgi:hypothetical protein
MPESQLTQLSIEFWVGSGKCIGMLNKPRGQSRQLLLWRPRPLFVGAQKCFNRSQNSAEADAFLRLVGHNTRMTCPTEIDSCAISRIGCDIEVKRAGVVSNVVWRENCSPKAKALREKIEITRGVFCELTHLGMRAMTQLTSLLSDALPRVPELEPGRNQRVHCSSLRPHVSNLLHPSR